MPAKPTLSATSQGKPPREGGASPEPTHQVHPHVRPREGPVPPPRPAPSQQPAPQPEAAPPDPRGQVELAGGGRREEAGQAIRGEIGDLQILVNRLRVDLQYRRDYIERQRLAGYTRERAQEIAAMYERQFAELRQQEDLTRANLWRLIAELL